MELVRDSRHYAETECVSDERKSLCESESRQPSDNSIISSWMLSSRSEQSIDFDNWDLEQDEVVQRARQSLKCNYDCKVWTYDI